MKKNVFRLENVLKYRTLLKEQKRIELLKASQETGEQESLINGRIKGVNSARAELSRQVRSGACDPGLLHMVDDFVAGEAIRLRGDKEKMRELQFTQEAKLQALVEAQKQVKSLETLKAKKADEYRKEVLRSEQEELDDFVLRPKLEWMKAETKK